MKTTNEFIFFWSGEDFLSNFYFSPFEMDGKVFGWSEQAIMYEKARLFGSEKIANQILEARTPRECKRLGRSREIPFSESVWEENREELYKKVLRHKFAKEPLRSMLMETSPLELVEASPYDKIWGVGLSAEDPRITNRLNWKGLNLLGKVLMEVREELYEKENG